MKMKFTRAEFLELAKEFAPQEAAHLENQIPNDYLLPEDALQTLASWVFGYPWIESEEVMGAMVRKLSKLKKATITFTAGEIQDLAKGLNPPMSPTPMETVRILRRIEEKSDFNEGLSWGAIEMHIREVVGYPEDEEE
jgi:hypothetical protein